MLKLPPLNALKAFEAAARGGSYVAAAAELGVSAAAVSQQVRNLEGWVIAALGQTGSMKILTMPPRRRSETSSWSKAPAAASSGISKKPGPPRI